VDDTIIRMEDNNRAPGDDAVNAELVKDSGRSLRKNIHQLIVSILEKEEISKEWKKEST
jgi:hypothetical protein